MSVRRASTTLLRTFSSSSRIGDLGTFQTSVELETWLRGHGVSVLHASVVAPKLFGYGYTDASTFLCMSEETLRKTGIPDRLAEILITQLQPPKYSLFGSALRETSAATVGELLQATTYKEKQLHRYPLAVLGASGQPLGQTSLLERGQPYRVVYEYAFPEQFKAQSSVRPEDHKIVGIEPVIKKAMQHIDENIQKTISPFSGVPPLVISALARSGKTTVLRQLFNSILQGGNYLPIFVKLKMKGAKVRDFLRAVITQLDPDANPSSKQFFFSKQCLDDYLNLAGKPVVLLVDDLIAPSPKLAQLLREMFLDQQGRFLCFTQTPSRLVTKDTLYDETDGLGPADEPPRWRRVLAVPHSLHLDTLRLIVPELSPAEALLFGGLPGLAYAIKVRHSEYSKVFFSRFTCHPLSNHLGPFLREVFCGFACTPPEFAEFTYHDDQNRVVWPLCYVGTFLTYSGQDRLADLIQDTATPSSAWEYLVRVGVGLAALSAGHTELTEVQARVLGVRGHRPQLLVLTLDADIDTLAKAQEYIQPQIKTVVRTSDSILVLAFPQNKDFPLFNCLVWFHSPHTSCWRGIRTQLDNDDEVCPEQDCPADCLGILFCRNSSSTLHTNCLHTNWACLTPAQFEDFFPYSVLQLLASQENTNT